MILSHTAVYALRAMSVLAEAEAGAVLRAEEVAQQADIPAHYVAKVMRKMVVAGLVQSRKGHGGGFALARAAGGIKFREILAAVDVVIETDRCAFSYRRCNPKKPCPLHSTWSRLHEQLADWAEGSTLASVRAGSRRT